MAQKKERATTGKARSRMLRVQGTHRISCSKLELGCSNRLERPYGQPDVKTACTSSSELVRSRLVLELGSKLELELVRSKLVLELALGSKLVLALVRSKLELELVLGSKQVLELVRSMLVLELGSSLVLVRRRSLPYGIRTGQLRWLGRELR